MSLFDSLRNFMRRSPTTPTRVAANGVVAQQQLQQQQAGTATATSSAAVAGGVKSNTTASGQKPVQLMQNGMMVGDRCVVALRSLHTIAIGC